MRLFGEPSCLLQELIAITIVNGLSGLCLICRRLVKIVSCSETPFMLFHVKESGNVPPGDNETAGISYRWPVAILVVGLAMTLAWGGFIVWVALRLLHIV